MDARADWEEGRRVKDWTAEGVGGKGEGGGGGRGRPRKSDEFGVLTSLLDLSSSFSLQFAQKGEMNER